MDKNLVNVEEALQNATYGELQNGLKIKIEIENVSGMNADTVLAVFKHLQNEEHGVANRALCSHYNVNTLEVIKLLHDKGWINEINELTIKGVMEMNGVHDDFDIKTDRLVLQDWNGSLYWDRTNENFEKIWSDVLSLVKKENMYNKQLKNSTLPFSPRIKKMLNSTIEIKVLNKYLLKKRRRG